MIQIISRREAFQLTKVPHKREYARYLSDKIECIDFMIEVKRKLLPDTDKLTIKIQSIRLQTCLNSTLSFCTQWNMKIKSPCREFSTVKTYAMTRVCWLRYKRPKVQVRPSRNMSTKAPRSHVLQEPETADQNTIPINIRRIDVIIRILPTHIKSFMYDFLSDKERK